jgi:ParB-like chromosome segregation protein Spo0J
VPITLETWPADSLIGYARNPRNNDHAVDQMASAIKEFGFRIPVVAQRDGTIVDGHLRKKAADKLGLTEIPVIPADDLTDAQIKAFRLVANKSAEWAEWANDLLQIELSELHDEGFDLKLTGFSGEELSTLMYDPQFEPGTADDQGQLDQKAPKMVTCPHCEAKFDASDQV